MSKPLEGHTTNRLANFFTAPPVPGLLYLSGLGLGVASVIAATPGNGALAFGAHALSIAGLYGLFARHRGPGLTGLFAGALAARVGFAITAALSLMVASTSEPALLIAMFALPAELLCLSFALGRLCRANGHHKMAKLLGYNAGAFALSDVLAVGGILALGIIGAERLPWLAEVYIVGLYGLLVTALVYMSALGYTAIRVRA